MDATRKPPLDLLIAAPRGFCAGVDRAIRIVELAIEKYGAPVYVRHEIVHNKYVVDSLKAKGAIFVEELDQVPEGSMTLIETVADVATFTPRDPETLSFLTQTTLSIDDTAEVVAALEAKFPAIQAPRGEDICYATSNRQTAIKAIAGACDAVLVLGAPNSSNSLRLVEVAERQGIPARLLQRASELDWGFLDGIGTLGITAGASAPEQLVRELIDRLAERFDITEREVETTQETIAFKLPRGLEVAA